MGLFARIMTGTRIGRAIDEGPLEALSQRRAARAASRKRKRRMHRMGKEAASLAKRARARGGKSARERLLGL